MSRSPTRVHRLLALPQLTALLLSLGLAFEVSVCPLGMDMGMEMPPAMDATGQTGIGPGAGSGMDCPFMGSLDDEGQQGCPLAVGGIGPCGTSAPAPTELVTAPRSSPLSAVAYVSATSGHADFSETIQLPPPRA
jgi:hypothetical protein